MPDLMTLLQLIVLPLAIVVIGLLVEYWIIQPLRNRNTAIPSSANKDWTTSIQKGLRKFKAHQSIYNWNWWSINKHIITIEALQISRGKATLALAISDNRITIQNVIARYNLVIDSVGDILSMEPTQIDIVSQGDASTPNGGGSPQTLPHSETPYRLTPIESRPNVKVRTRGALWMIIPGSLIVWWVFSALNVILKWPIHSPLLIDLAFLPYLGISLALLLLNNLFGIHRMFLQGKSRQDEALNELQRHIQDRIERFEPILLTSRSIRSLAYSIEKTNRCAIITNKLIGEAIRAVFLELEASDRFVGSDLTRRLRKLDSLLRDIDSDSPPMLSLALVDRLYAYKNSQPTAVIMTVLGILIISIFQKALVLAPVLLFIELILVFSTIRAQLFWEHTSSKMKMPLKSKLTRWLSADHPNLFLDFFMLVSTSRHRWADAFWYYIWLPWEQPFIQKSSSNPEKFAVMHEFRYDLAEDLYAQLRRIQREIDISRMKGLPPQYVHTQQIALLSRQLWIVTGDERLREIERRGELTVEDVANSVLRFL